MGKSIMNIICGSLMKQIREGQNLGLKYAALESGICLSKLSKIENGRQLLDMISLCELCKVYDIAPGAFTSIVGAQYLHHSPFLKKSKGSIKKYSSGIRGAKRKASSEAENSSERKYL